MIETGFDLAFPGVATNAGLAVVGPVGPARSDETWIIEQISVSGTVPAGTHALATVYVNTLFKMSSRTGELDTASQAPPITLGPGEILSCNWSGLTPSTPVQLRVTGKQRFS